MRKICSSLTITTPEWYSSGVSTVDFHHHHIRFNVCFQRLHELDGFLWKTFKYFCFS